MPPERSRGSRRTGADGNQLVWTLPVEPVSPGGISFATNITPVTFNDQTALIERRPVVEPTDEDDLSVRTGHAKKRSKSHIPRPPNAFILFRSAFIKSQRISTDVETNHSTLSKIIGITWQNLPDDERQVWHDKAKAALEEHKVTFPHYTFRPQHAKQKRMEKRKVREVGVKDVKRCNKIAELVGKGKKGKALIAAVQEFDKTHVPEIVTRFDTPLTAQMFRARVTEGSSSQSSSDDEDEAPAPTMQKRARLPKCSAKAPEESLEIGSSPYPASDPYFVVPHHEPSFDMNTFSYDHITTAAPAMSYIGDGMIQFNSMFNEEMDDRERPPLSIDTSFIPMDAWSMAPSPMDPNSMPGTPGPYYTNTSPCSSYPPTTPGTPLDGCIPYTTAEELALAMYGAECQQLSYIPTASMDPYQTTHAQPCHFEDLSIGIDFDALMRSMPAQYQM